MRKLSGGSHSEARAAGGRGGHRVGSTYYNDYPRPSPKAPVATYLSDFTLREDECLDILRSVKQRVYVETRSVITAPLKRRLSWGQVLTRIPLAVGCSACSEDLSLAISPSSEYLIGMDTFDSWNNPMLVSP